MPSLRSNREINRGQLAKAGTAAVFILFLTSIFLSSTAKAADEQVCSFAIDFGDRVVWADVPIKEGMNGFDVFLNATKMLDLSEMHSDTPPYGHTVQRVENYSMQYDFANPKASGKVWHLWYWDDAKNTWSVSNTLLDGIDPTTTPAILLIYVKDPYPDPTLPLEHEPTVVKNSSDSRSFQYEVDGMNVIFNAIPTNESNVTSYSWSFGDGTSEEGKSVSHTYSAEGKYFVKLRMTFAEGGSSNETRALTIGSTASGSEKFPIWGWGVLALIGLGGIEAAFLYRRKLRRVK